MLDKTFTSMLLRLLRMVTWASIAAALLAASIFPISSGDVWWHVATGNYILTARTIPRHDVFSFSAQGKPWVTHEWLFEVLMALLFRFGGTTVLILFKAALVLATFLFVTLTLHRLKVVFPIAAALLLASVPLLTFRSFVRPHVATETLLAFYTLLLFSITRDNTPCRRQHRLLLLLPIQLVWANIHAGAVFGPLLFFLFAVGEFLQSRLSPKLSRQESNNARTLALVGLALFAISLLNPNGWRALAYPLTLTGSNTFTSAITELHSPFKGVYRHSDFFVAFMLMFGSGIISFLFARPLRITHLLLFASFGATALLALRNVPLFAVIAAPIVAANLGLGAKRPLRPRAATTLQTVVTLLSILFLARILTSGTRLPGGFRRPGLGIERRAFPVSAAEFIARNNIAGNVFNTMEYGGYLIWRWFPERLVFIDGRLDVYGPHFFEQYRRALWSGPQFDSIVAEHGINCVLLAYPPSLDVSTSAYLGRTLALRHDWSLVHWDDNSLVYLRNVEPNRRVIEQNRYWALIPMLLWPEMPDSAAPDQLIAEARRAVTADPRSSRARTALGLAFLRDGQVASARHELEVARTIDPSSRAALQGLAMAAVATGDIRGAADLIRQLVRLNPNDPVMHYNLGYALWQLADTAGARREFEASLRIDSTVVAAYNGLAEIALAHGDTALARRHTESVLRFDSTNPHALTRWRRLSQLQERGVGEDRLDW